MGGERSVGAVVREPSRKALERERALVSVV